jgi:UDP-sugar transporter A1/2/3
MALLSPRFISLALLCVHYSLLTIVMHISRTTSPSPYKASSAVVLTELGKLVTSTCLAWHELRKRVQDDRRTIGLGIRSVRLSPDHRDHDTEKQNNLKAQQTEHRKRHSVSTASFSPLPQGHARSTSVSHRISFEGFPHDEFLPESPSVPSRSANDAPVNMWRLLYAEVFGPRWWALGLPAVLFTVQANLQYLASSNLSVPAFQVTYQLKVRLGLFRLSRAPLLAITADMSFRSLLPPFAPCSF